MKLDALIALPRLHTASYSGFIPQNEIVLYKLSLLNIIKTNKRVRILKTHLLF